MIEMFLILFMMKEGFLLKIGFEKEETKDLMSKIYLMKSCFNSQP
jgi:hypothetical protein